MIKRKNDSKWKYICGVLLIILVLGGLLSQLHTSAIQAKNKKLDQEVTQLEEQNSKLSKNINDLNASVEANLTNDDGSELNKQIAEVAKKFVELYPVYDIEKVEEKKADLEKIATSSVADSIVPNDMIRTSKKTLESKSTTQIGEAYSSDPTFKSKYKDSKLYTNYVNANTINYFAEVNYKTESSSGDTENTVYMLFEVTNKDGRVLVDNYEIKYLK
ncbi:cell division protein FtsL [Enterococcus mundtii]|uniref:cell division protein FtsL n=1 Tax=Enterococcus mundtii TaxID=53346 RepID=UPI0013769AC9|nr:cell division protein FtsL [Enterococcus mundtii]NBA63210.1 cell division protein FtsL [Enterococcus mundtii]